MRMMKRSILTLAVLALLFSSAGQARAGIIGVTNRGSLGATDFVDWGTLGPAFTNISNPFSVISNGGVSLTVAQQGASSFQRRDQGNGWGGNFAPGDHLLWTQGSNGPVTMTYGLTNGVSAIGAQIQSNAFGPFTATITAYDSSHNVIGSFTENGNSTGNGDNSAIFLGVQSTTGNDIFSIQYSVSSGLGQDFGINQLDFRQSPTATPEPASMTLLGLGALGLMGYGWRKRKQNAAIKTVA